VSLYTLDHGVCKEGSLIIDYLESFEDNKAKEQEQLKTVQGNIVTTLEHISEVTSLFVHNNWYL